MLQAILLQLRLVTDTALHVLVQHPVSATVCLTCSLLVYYRLKAVNVPELVSKPTSSWTRFLRQHVPLLSEAYWCSVWCYEARAHTLAASLLSAAAPALTYRREILTLWDGGQISLDWIIDPRATQPVKPDTHNSCQVKSETHDSCQVKPDSCDSCQVKPDTRDSCQIKPDTHDSCQVKSDSLDACVEISQTSDGVIEACPSSLQNGSVAKGNGSISYRNGSISQENGVIAQENGVIAQEIGVIAQENGVPAHGNGSLHDDKALKKVSLILEEGITAQTKDVQGCSLSHKDSVVSTSRDDLFSNKYSISIEKYLVCNSNSSALDGSCGKSTGENNDILTKEESVASAIDFPPRGTTSPNGHLPPIGDQKEEVSPVTPQSPGPLTSTDLQFPVTDQPLLLLLPGLTGSSESEYVKAFVGAGHLAGYKCVVVNNRGQGGVALKTPRTYCAANCEDLAAAVEHL
ncbi:uncharacterized protein LOC108677905, partial [Hyalella azteca]|uniref:Uncharacterized protein LOC108677905 n=1 Tax=Hyalella azteca TaxID=294128 RepID=A0A8B7P760_HYAAZ